MGKKKLKSRSSNWSTHVILTAWVLLIIIPTLWVVLNSLKSSANILIDPYSLPVPPHVENYENAWLDAGLGRGFINSIYITFLSVFSIVFFASLPAYVMARKKFAGKALVYYYFISGLMFPTFVAMVPLFLLMAKLNLLNNHFGLILVYTAYSLPFTIFILYAFFKALPRSLEEAAVIDGAGPFRTFFTVMLPLAKPGLISAAIFNVVGIWNEYVLALILIQTPELKTLPVSIANLMLVMQYKTDWGALYAGLIMSIIPVVIIYLIFQRQLAEQTTAGAVKE
ncbi:carbohydrate ABC transporter permease [Radiobacillus sp. PE A8.2]|uniref:carbohydrate ABC transporter permease n=1 Tax=Radiobacillus sp. PE A8.2 TaxID=3380349 RepID=UPI00388FF1B7